MKLLFFIHSLSTGGAERVTATLANHWAAKNWSVTVVTITNSNRDFYSLDRRIKCIPLGLDGNSQGPISAVFHNFARVRALRAVMQQELPDIAVAMMATANSLLAIASRGLKIPVVGSERTYPPALPLGRIWETVRRWSYTRLSGLVAQTEASADWLRKNAYSPLIKVIPNPLTYPIIPQQPRLSVHAAQAELGCRYLLLTVGRLTAEKAFDRLIDAFAGLESKYSDWGLVILGDGPLLEELKSQISALGIGHKVRLPGRVGNVGEWFARADLYALTSHFEGFPNTLVEALAHGLPAIAVDCLTGPREILRHEVDGLLVPQDDHDALVTTLDRLMSDVGLRSQFSVRAVEARERFATARIAWHWEALFTELINKKMAA